MKSTRRILVVEDDPPTQELLARHLKSLGCRVDVAPDGSAALSLWERNDYDLVLTDLSMPGMSGPELIARMRSAERPRARSVPVIAMTGYAASDLAPRDLAGANAFLGKPFSVLDLRDLLDRWLTPSSANDAGNAMASRPAPGAAGHERAARTSKDDRPGDPEILSAIAATFIATIPEYLQELGAACAGRNRAAVEAAAHKLKSAARLVGGTDVALLCEAVERAGPNVQFDEIVSLAGRIPDALAALEQLLAAAAATRGAGSS